MLVILEGPDRSGKTTLAQNLKVRFEAAGKKCEIFKRKERSENPTAAIFTHVFPLVYEETVWIADRLHLTESVFSSYYNREVVYPYETIGWIDTCFAIVPRRTALMLLFANPTVLEARHLATNEPPEFDVEAVSDLFVSAFEMSSMMKTWLDTGELDEQALTDEAFSALWGLFYCQETENEHAA